MEPKKALKASRMWQRALLVTGIGVLAAGSVAGVSFALTSSSGSPAAAGTTASAKPSTSTKANGLRQRELQVLRRTVSGQIEIATKNGFVTFEFDRGVVTSISSSDITILRPDGKSVTEGVNGSTRMPKRGVPAKGQNVVVISTGGNSYRIVDVGPFRPSGGSSSSSSSTGSSATSSNGSVSTT
ncbi:MAG: hypothetical protein ACLP6E_07850 [Acidimicrobiales bacterium]